MTRSYKTATVLVMALLTAVLFLVQPAARAANVTPLDLAIEINKGIAMLEAKQYVEFLDRFIHPNEKDSILENVSIEKFARDFGKEKAADLLQALKTTKRTYPIMSTDGQTASYNIQPRPLVFGKIDGLWYILN